MQSDNVIEIFCRIKNIPREDILGMNNSADVRYARQMLYLILREKCGTSSYKLAAIFNRARRNIVRGMSLFKHHVKLYKYMSEDYSSTVKKIEGMADAAPSEDME